MNEVQRTALDLTSAALFGRTVNVSNDTDWQSVYDEILRHNLVSLLFPISAELDVPEDILERWSRDRDLYILNNGKNIGSHFSIQKLFDREGIPCVILKGIASASYYPNYLLRAFGDVDFLVPEEDYRTASKLLENNGFDYINRHDKHKIYSRGGIEYELHRDIMGIPDTSIRKVFREYFKDIFTAAVPFEHNGSACMIPSRRHHAVILLVHMADHLRKTGIGLRHLCDWAAFVHRMPTDFFEKTMQAALREMGIWHFAGVITCLCTKYLGLDHCPWADETADDYMAELMDDVLDAGEFGRLREEAALRDPSLGNRNSDILSTGTFKAFFDSLNKGARTVIPPAADYPILLPPGWIFILGRYMVRTLTGKRTIGRAKENIVRLGKRHDLTKEWRLFEKESDSNE